MEYSIEQINREQSASESDPFTVDRYIQFARVLGHDFAGSVLDVGCNTGRGGAAFKMTAPAAAIDGIDIVPERLKSLPADLYRATYLGVLEEVEFAAKYDAVLMGEVIEHVPYPMLEKFLADAKSLLNPGGKLLLTTPNPHYFLLKRRSHGSVLGGAHVSVHCPEALSQYLRFLGFGELTVRGTGRVSKVLGTRFPLPLYGAFMTVATVGSQDAT